MLFLRKAHSCHLLTRVKGLSIDLRHSCISPHIQSATGYLVVSPEYPHTDQPPLLYEMVEEIALELYTSQDKDPIRCGSILTGNPDSYSLDLGYVVVYVLLNK